MIIKGTSCAGARRLAVHLTRTDTNERAEVKELRGVVAQDLSGALREMEGVATGARTNKPFYHGSINTRADERLTDEQRAYAIDKLEEALGLTGQPRVVVVHEKEGREHCHIVWSRIDLDRMAAISDSNNYYKHEQVARALEKEFGHDRVQGAHIERDGKQRPDRTPSHSEMLQADRTGLSPQQARELMTGIWQSTKNGKEFQAALEDKGWILARGDRRDFVAIDPKGGIHSIARRIEGAKVGDVRQRFLDINPMDLRNVAEAKQTQRERQALDLVQTQRRIGEREGSDEGSTTRQAGDESLDWTNRGGMVEQQRSAMEWVRKTDDKKLKPTDPAGLSQAIDNKEQTSVQRRQERPREFDREPKGDLSKKKEQSRGRERSR